MIRWSVLAALLFIVPATAQTTVLEEASDDATATVGGLDVPYDASAFDLAALLIEEQPQDFGFTLRVADLQRDAETDLDSGFYMVDFQHADAGYRIQFGRFVLGGQVSYTAELMVFDSGRQGYVPVERLAVDARPEANTLGVTVPRELLVDGNGTAPTLGREFSFFKAFSRSSVLGLNGAPGVTVSDAMPDTGFSQVPYAIQQGLRQSGHAALWSDDPVRASNGEQGTFVYYVQAENLDEQQDRFDLSVANVPNGWDVTLPASTIRIDGNSTQPFPVVVTTPFAHQHGAFESFVLKMTSHRDAQSVGQLQMGIRYLEVPQPAGHHDRLWIHARTDGNQQGLDLLSPTQSRVVGYMNAAEDDGVGQAMDIPPTQTFSSIATSQFEWIVWLEPGLQLGLDFDLSRTGLAELEFTSDLPYSDVVLSGQLMHYEGVERTSFGFSSGAETLLGDLAPTTPVTVNGPTRIETIFTAKPDADFIEYTDRGALALHLRLESSSQGPILVTDDVIMPRLLTGGTLTLPLFEYRDPVKDVFNTLAGISLRHQDRAEKFVNPGETVLLNLTLSNDGAVDDILSLRVNGTNQGWARFLGDTTVFVPTGASRPVVLAISPPTTALDGDVVDLIVTAASDAEPTVQTQIRVVGIVDDLLDRPDESALTGEIESRLTKDKDSPGLPLLLVLGALVALVRRR